MVRLAGFEPTTPWFVAKYSIQLSYSREASQYNTVYSDLGKPGGGFETTGLALEVALLFGQPGQQ